MVNICLEESNPVVRTSIKDGMESSGSLEQVGAWNAGGEFPLLAVVHKLQHQGIDFSRLKVRSSDVDPDSLYPDPQNLMYPDPDPGQ